MNLLTIEKDRLIIEPKGLDKIWSFTNKIEIPFKNIISVSIDKKITNERKGIRLLGLATFSKWSGTFISKKEKNFWNVTRTETPIVIALRNEKFKRLIIGVANAEEWAIKLNRLVTH
ncbi:PH domain-containing protein [Pseudolactococcus plantarum]|uniref:Bacterial Pleckstrin homology domain-containing protein n=1 Tax=Pseudolactococcus plantarum TaxID=1365 RepID=A0A2A5S0G3_9LACT|nr:PH domain-containing protein [Lactococcus plantarum]PCS06971.1 hypothetical protein RU87_GL001431 [Lactococcus plantarum]HCN74643.1 hypothetical protein [Lactococcus sp.]